MFEIWKDSKTGKSYKVIEFKTKDAANDWINKNKNHYEGWNLRIEEAPETTITLSNSMWNRLSIYLLSTTKYREGEYTSWLELAKEKNVDGTPKFQNAEDNAEFWQNMIKDMNLIQSTIGNHIIKK